jgi:hypothetical protein
MFINTTPAGHTFLELTEQAREAALQAVARAYHTTGDPAEADQLATALTAALAAALGHPGGGCHPLEVTVWDDDRAHHWSLAGTLHPVTAPALPWTPGIHTVSIAWHRRIHIHTDRQPAPAEVERMRTTVQATIAGAWQTAHQQVAAWQALEWVAACRPRFTATGALTPTQPRRAMR